MCILDDYLRLKQQEADRECQRRLHRASALPEPDLRGTLDRLDEIMRDYRYFKQARQPERSQTTAVGALGGSSSARRDGHFVAARSAVAEAQVPISSSRAGGNSSRPPAGVDVGTAIST